MIYLVEPTENTRIKSLAKKSQSMTIRRHTGIQNGYRSLKYQVFDKLECVDQGTNR